MIKPQDFVITNKGNHGKVISVGTVTAKVKIGYNVHEIDIQNLYRITDGTILHVNYLNSDGVKNRGNVFIKHGTILSDGKNDMLLNLVTNLMTKQLKEEITVLNILIP